MMKWLIWMGILTAMADPILLYWIFSTWGFWAGMTAMIGPIILGNAIANATYHRAQSEGDPTVLLSIPARLLLWYPGPLTSVMGLILMTRFAQKKVASYALGKVMQSATSAGNAGGFNVQSSWVVMGNSAGPGAPMGPMGLPGPAIRSGGLKQTEGRVIDDDNTKQLPPGNPGK